MKQRAVFRSIGAYVPQTILTNADLEKRVETSDEWIVKRTGISQRRIADTSEQTSDLALHAAEVAIKRAGIAKEDIDLIVLATISPDYFCMPSTACILAQKLGIRDVAAMDISAACSGFIYALSTAKAYVESGMKHTVLVVGAETMSRIIDYSDRSTCILFGDGAGAAIISAGEEQEKGIVDIHISADGTFSDFLMTPLPSKDTKDCFVQMKGNETFKLAVKTLSADVVDMLAKNQIDISAVSHFIPHQANYRIIKAVGDTLGISDDKTVLTVGKYGNTSGASIPMAINDAYESGRLKNGDLMLLDAFGGGLTWGSCLAYFGGN